MSNEFFKRAYETTTQDGVKDLYDDWAVSYDSDLIQNGYVTPKRCAAALAMHLSPRDVPILDFACGTGLSGAALAAQGFTVIDGIDISAKMINAARNRGIYRNLNTVEPGEPPNFTEGSYAAIAAMGAISRGAAPPEYIDFLLSCLAPGGILVMSFNDHTFSDPDYMSRLQNALDRGIAHERFQEHGDHIIRLGSKSIVYVLERNHPAGG